MTDFIRYAGILAFSLMFFVSCKEKPADVQAKDAVAAKGTTTGTKYTTNRTMSEIFWEGKSPGGAHVGSIKVAEGELYFDQGFTGGKFTIDMTTINVMDLNGEEKQSLESHLKGTGKDGVADFFNVTKYPTATFEIVEISGASAEHNSNSTVTGNLTMLGVSKLISFAANISVSPAEITITTNPFSINRTDWGIKYGSKSFFQDLKDKFIEDNINLRISLRAVSAAAPTM
jgi:polyisoprenoid-binding protein YceI